MALGSGGAAAGALVLEGPPAPVERVLVVGLSVLVAPEGWPAGRVQPCRAFLGNMMHPVQSA